ncbi:MULTISPECIES: hypothetical protein [Prosthecochloris]|uniref:hypothetical protein n=1 Tax=Prosthecochloris TaxID=1101 RepID=UPI001EFC54BA|nr:MULTISPECIES: hypothetical protein [Prosthecochloris]UZJ36894.1 hypothetical protein OO005_09050 [Prosthecochloris sp. SCSIO W1103]UZJ39836.1 hypothetical protein OO185_01700 [Prosthecochloris sp. SCSIO W1102]
MKKPKSTKSGKIPMPLEKINYFFIGIGIAVIAFSYTTMYLEENSANGFFSLYVSPVLLVGAYAWILFALLYRKKA